MQSPEHGSTVDRRDFLRVGAATAAGLSLDVTTQCSDLLAAGRDMDYKVPEVHIPRIEDNRHHYLNKRKAHRQLIFWMPYEGLEDMHVSQYHVVKDKEYAVTVSGIRYAPLSNNRIIFARGETSQILSYGDMQFTETYDFLGKYWDKFRQEWVYGEINGDPEVRDKDIVPVHARKRLILYEHERATMHKQLMRCVKQKP